MAVSRGKRKSRTSRQKKSRQQKKKRSRSRSRARASNSNSNAFNSLKGLAVLELFNKNNAGKMLEISAANAKPKTPAEAKNALNAKKS